VIKEQDAERLPPEALAKVARRVKRIPRLRQQNKLTANQKNNGDQPETEAFKRSFGIFRDHLVAADPLFEVAIMPAFWSV
jgi:hypothetical protein